MIAVIFEDNRTDDFYPLTQTRPVWELRSGLFTIRERFETVLKESFGDGIDLFYIIRNYLTPYYQERYPDLNIDDRIMMNYQGEIIFLNSVCDISVVSTILKHDTVIKSGSRIMAARFSSVDLDTGYLSLEQDLETIVERTGCDIIDEERAVLFSAVWDMMDKNPGLISDDFEIYNKEQTPDNKSTVTFQGKRGHICIHKEAVIDPFVYLDAGNGPVVIEKGAHIHSFSRIEGPCFIGRDSIILGGKIRSGTSIGPVCRIGGEVEQSIFQGYSNKYHDGFIGHSHIGEWINMGALTTNSDLKNDYSTVRVFTNNGIVDTNNSKIGCFMGDFVKTSIGTLINTGCVIGTGAMLIFDGTITPYHIPPFAWYFHTEINGDRGVDDFLASCKNMTKRRGVRFSDSFANMMKFVYFKYKGVTI